MHILQRNAYNSQQIYSVNPDNSDSQSFNTASRRALEGTNEHYLSSEPTYKILAERMYDWQKELNWWRTWQTWNTFLAIGIANSVFEKAGVLNVEKLQAIRDDLAIDPACQNPELGAHRKVILYLLDAVIENRDGVQEALRDVQAPLGRPCYDPEGNIRYRSQAAHLIRVTLGLSKSDVITDLHAQRAVFSALLSSIRQNDVGSCFATSFAIMFQQAFPAQFVKEMAYLIRYDALAMDLEGNFVLINTARAEGILKQTLQIEESGQFIDCSQNERTGADRLPEINTPTFFPLHEIPGILAALHAMNIDEEEGNNLLIEFTQAHAGKRVVIKDILFWVIEKHFSNKSLAAKRRRYEKGKIGFWSTIYHPFIRTLEYTLASLYSRGKLSNRRYILPKQNVRTPILEKIKTAPIPFIEDLLPGLVVYKEQYQSVPGFIEAWEKTLTSLPFIPYWEANMFTGSSETLGNSGIKLKLSDDTHYLGYLLLDGKFLPIHELTESVLIKDIFSRVHLSLKDKHICEVPEFNIFSSDTRIDWSHLVGDRFTFESINNGKSYNGVGHEGEIFNTIFSTTQQAMRQLGFSSHIDFDEEDVLIEGYKPTKTPQTTHPIVVLKKTINMLKKLGQPKHLGAVFAYHEHQGSINPGIESSFERLIHVENIDEWLQENLVKPTQALINPFVDTLEAIKSTLPNVPFMDANYDIDGNNACFSIIYDPFEDQFRFAKSLYDGDKFTVHKLDVKDERGSNSPYTINTFLILPADQALFEKRNQFRDTSEVFPLYKPA